MLAVLGLGASCADGQQTKSDAPSGEPGDNTGDGDSTGGNGGDGDLPPEHEEPLAFHAPQAGKNVVYVPNPATNRVAVVNAESFAIETLQTGRAPTFVATVPGQDSALVLNTASRDAALLRTKQGHTSVLKLDVGNDANAIALAPDGLHAVIYFDASRAEGDLDATSFQDVTVVNLREGKESSRGVSVGFRPRSVQFSADGSHAFVATEDGVSIIDLAEAVAGPTIARLVALGDAATEPVSSDLQITPDGKFALARRPDQPVLRLVDLASGALHTLDLSALEGSSPTPGDAGVPDAGDAGAVTPAKLDLSDVDLAPDGSFALAVERNRKTLLRIPIPAGFDDHTLIERSVFAQQPIGSVTIAPTGKLAVLYTTASAVESLLLLDLTNKSAARGVRLRKLVRAVALSDDGSRMLVVHAPGKPDANADAEEQRIDKAQGYSLVDTTSGFVKLKLTAAEVGAEDVFVTPDASRLFVALRDDEQQVAAYETADLGSFQVDSYTLSAPPASLGMVPGVKRVFIGQESEGGMISFIDALSGKVVRPVAGFELATRVRR